MGQRSRASRGDRRRNERISRLRGLVPVDHAVLGVDLADEKQVVVVTDHDSRVLARRRVVAKAWQLAEVIWWGRRVAQAAGFKDVTVACEPTGHRWRALDQLAAEAVMRLVCVQPLLIGRAREQEDYTGDKTDDKDAVLIARLAVQLHCYAPERPDATWARLRQLGGRRDQLIVSKTRAAQQLQDLLECAWPAVLATAARPVDSQTWRAALMVVLSRCHGDPARLRRMGLDAFTAAVRRQARSEGGRRVWRRIAAAVFDACNDPAGVGVQRPGALERARWTLQDWHHASAGLVEVETRMVAVLDELGVRELATSIDGLSAVGAAAILAETGDLTRFDSPRAVVKHAGLAPARNASGEKNGRTRLTGRGRPRLRLAAWRAVWGALQHNQVMAARYRHLTSRQHNRLSDGQARAALAAALLRWLHVVITNRCAWDPVKAADRTRGEDIVAA